MHNIIVKRPSRNRSHIYEQIIEYHVGHNYIRFKRKNRESEVWIPFSNLLWFKIVEVKE